MFIASYYFITLLPLLGLAVIGWLISLKNDNVTIVDSLWAIFFLFASVTNYMLDSFHSERAQVVLILVLIWSIRLSTYLYLRNRHKPEDHRYQLIRLRNEPHFKIKSIYIVFGLQACLAWFISLPLHVSLHSTSQLKIADYIGVSLWLIGMLFQTVGDFQLARFKDDLGNIDKVLASGLWRYTRHPNYFGESCIWFGYGLIAIGAGQWWTIISSFLMTYLLINITGARLLESDIAERRPDYKKYIQNTPQFFPWFPES